MTLRICTAIFLITLAGGIATAFVGKHQPAHADICGGYSC